MKHLDEEWVHETDGTCLTAVNHSSCEQTCETDLIKFLGAVLQPASRGIQNYLELLSSAVDETTMTPVSPPMFLFSVFLPPPPSSLPPLNISSSDSVFPPSSPLLPFFFCFHFFPFLFSLWLPWQQDVNWASNRKWKARWRWKMNLYWSFELKLDFQQQKEEEEKSEQQQVEYEGEMEAIRRRTRRRWRIFWDTLRRRRRRSCLWTEMKTSEGSLFTFTLSFCTFQ